MEGGFFFFTFKLLLLHDVHWSGAGLELDREPPSSSSFKSALLNFLPRDHDTDGYPSIHFKSLYAYIHFSSLEQKNALVFHRKWGTCIQSQGLV
ncbi:hypothetical protein K440DRAFT_625590 [Wilcoxina mikolae CBS 423.85]|nr:hypothetical protein K440DRAFT_625590 [Wilcoxina mikolae CBS 423.85]